MASSSLTRADVAAFVEKDDDLVYERDLVAAPYAVKTWVAYIVSKAGAPARVRNTLAERALRLVPGAPPARPAWALCPRAQSDARARTRPRGTSGAGERVPHDVCALPARCRVVQAVGVVPEGPAAAAARARAA